MLLPFILQNLSGTAPPVVTASSGVRRLDTINRQLLAEITEALNTKKEVPVQAIAQVVTNLVEQPDGSYVEKPKTRKKKSVKAVEKVLPEEKIEYYLPVTHTFTLFMRFVQQSPIDHWAEQKVLEVLKNVLREQKIAQIAEDNEEELIIEMAGFLLA